MSVKERKDSYQLLSKQYELVAPDGGWGYVVALAAIVVFTSTTGFAGCFGMIYNDFMTEVGMTSADVTLSAGIVCMAVAFSGFFTSALLKRMSLRKLAFAAVIVYCGGTFGQIIMTTKLHFYIFQGVMQGSGLGIIMTLTFTAMNDYFVKKRVLVMSFVQTVTGILTMVAPMFIKWALERYGFRGCMIILAGISLSNVFAVLTFQPIKRHLKKVEIPGAPETYEPLTEKVGEKKLDTPVIKLTDIEENITKLNYEGYSEDNLKKSFLRKALESFLDIELCKSFILTCPCLGPAIVLTADNLYLMIFPQYLYTMEWSQENVALSIMAYGFGDMITRVLLIFISKWVDQLGVQKIYVFGIGVAVFSRFGLLWSPSAGVTTVLVYTALMGVSHCVIAVLMPMVISDAVAPEKFTAAMGFCLLVLGVTSMVLGPVVGAIRDYTNNYDAAFYVITLFYLMFLILWPIELFVRSRRMKKLKTESSNINK
ncbi:monocarboxylate transporter 6-like [Trichoplusia ni]|uniref:Monocarboxylate transporter 6-like n=1 Tax=Trichoplusia ni TaxID=7111 RepID=A0A7E5WEG6_TRINI|nr:monocarboxylate transporter 6-like [Trichoplusia ni]